MENLRRFKTALGTYDWSLAFKWSEAVKPDLALADRYYAGAGGGCGLYADNEPLGGNHSSPAGDWPLSGLDIDLIAVPFHFGYDDAFVLSDQNGDPLTMWCGQLKSLLMYALRPQQSGAARVVVRELPTAPAKMMELLFHNNGKLLSLGNGFAGGALESNILKAIIQRGPLMDCYESGNMITRKVYHRREFAFLDTFSPAAWGNILIAMTALTLIISLLGRSESFERRVTRWTRRETIKGRLIAAATDWPFLWIELGGLLWGQGGFTVGHYHRGLICLWLLSCTILGGCLAGSLRDMMNTAMQVIVPDTWADLWESPWQSHILVTTTIYWDELVDRFGLHRMEGMRDAGRLITIPPQ